VFDKTGKFERELGQDVYGFNAAIGLRVDPQDNVWTIDEAASQVVKFDTEGRVALVLGRKPEAINVRPNQPATAPASPSTGSGQAGGATAGQASGGGGGGGAAQTGAGRARPARVSAVRPTSRGIARATSILRTASPTTIASPSSTRTAGSSSTGARPVLSPASSTA
jgi:hypothetical protein